MKSVFMNHGRVFFFCLLVSLILVPAAVGAEETRIALVVGNANYGGDASLKNPVNDATDMAAGLEKIGWNVIKVTDVTRRDFNRAIDEFNTRLEASPGASALFYYAGHGIQFGGNNYLIPVKVELETEADVKSEAIDLAAVTDVMKTQKVNVALVVLDACRDNPFLKGKTRSGASPNRGLSSAVPNKVGAKGLAVMFATGPGDVAQDGKGRNGLFTAAFLKYMADDLEIDAMFKKVSQEVVAASKNGQVPWINKSISSDFYLVPESKRKSNEIAVITTPAPTPAPVAEAPAVVWRGKARFQSTLEGEVYQNGELVGAVGPDIPLEADALQPGKQEFILMVDGVSVESKTITVTEKAYTTVLFGKKAPVVIAPVVTPAPAPTQAPEPVPTPAPVQPVAAAEPLSASQTDLGDSSVVAMAREKFKGKYVLKVEGPAAGMRVLINGEAVGLTPLALEIPVENALVEIVHDDYEPWQQKVYPLKGEEIVLKVNTGRSKNYLRTEAIQEYASLREVLKKTKDAKVFPQTMAGMGWLTMLGGVALGAYGWVTGNDLLTRYDAATDTAVIADLRNQIQQSDDYLKGGLITAAGGFLGALFFEILVPDDRPAQKKVNDSYQHVMNLGGF